MRYKIPVSSLLILFSMLIVLTVLAFRKPEPVIAVSCVEKETPIATIVAPEVDLPYTDAELDLITLVTMAEAEGESAYGQRLVIDVILNRVDSPYFPDSVNEVVYQRNQFESVWNGRIERCYVDEHIRDLVVEECTERVNDEVVFFRTGRYSSYGEPAFRHENHYFSTYGKESTNE